VVPKAFLNTVVRSYYTERKHKKKTNTNRETLSQASREVGLEANTEQS